MLILKIDLESTFLFYAVELKSFNLLNQPVLEKKNQRRRLRCVEQTSG